MHHPILRKKLEENLQRERFTLQNDLKCYCRCLVLRRENEFENIYTSRIEQSKGISLQAKLYSKSQHTIDFRGSEKKK